MTFQPVPNVLYLEAKPMMSEKGLKQCYLIPYFCLNFLICLLNNFTILPLAVQVHIG